jgi:hypothetical protein
MPLQWPGNAAEDVPPPTTTTLTTSNPLKEGDLLLCLTPLTNKQGQIYKLNKE